MKKSIVIGFAYVGLWACICFVCSCFSSCHALVVADKLYYQGSVAKSLPDKVEVTDTTFISVNHE